MKKNILIYLLIFNSSIFANGMGGGAGLADPDGTSPVPIILDCYYHNVPLGIPHTLYETHIIYYTNQVESCSKDPNILVSMGAMSPLQAEHHLAQDPECYTFTTRAQ